MVMDVCGTFPTSERFRNRRICRNPGVLQLRTLRPADHRDTIAPGLPNAADLFRLFVMISRIRLGGGAGLRVSPPLYIPQPEYVNTSPWLEAHFGRSFRPLRRMRRPRR